jgi:glyoxylase-like metal-dependent hydrolase (beta-lactamase superfamily II)
MSHVETVRVGGLEVEVICEGFSALALDDECPGRSVDWDAERERHGWAFHGVDAWAWHVHAFVVRGPWGIVLVDSGTGPFGPWRPWAWSDPDAWDGLDRAEVHHVVLTHLHADHAGGVVVGGEARFPNAVVHVHPGDWAAFADAGDGGYDARRALEVVATDGALDLGGPDRDVVPGVALRHTPGHTPGHRSVVVRDGDETLLITGDLLHLPIQAAHPTWPSSHDDDPRLGAASRQLTLWRARNAGWRLAVGHFAVPFGRLDEHGWRSGPNGGPVGARGAGPA